MGRETAHRYKNTEYKTNYYVDGNTVRRMEAAPIEQPERQYEREQERRERVRRQPVRRHQESAQHLSMGYVLFCAVAVFLVIGVCAQFIRLQTDITDRLKNISKLESQVMNLRAENDAVMKRLEMSTDLEAVKVKAMTELGMQYASDDQIIYYSVEASDYMSQYADVPEN